MNEHELLALLVEATVNRGVKKSKQVRIPRPELERPKKPIKQRFREVARMMKGGADG